MSLYVVFFFLMCVKRDLASKSHNSFGLEYSLCNLLYIINVGFFCLILFNMSYLHFP